MGTIVTYNGTIYTVPAQGESGYGPTMTNFLVDVANSAVTATGTANLTNKILSAPTLNNPTISNPTWSGAITFTSAGVGTLTVSTAGTAPTMATADNSTNIATTAYVQANVSTINTNLTTNYAPKASPALTGTPTAPTATNGTNTTQIATTAFVMTQAFSAVLPNQAGNGGKFVTTDGVNASWAPVASMTYVTSNTTATTGATYLCDTSSAAFNLTLPAKASGLNFSVIDVKGTFATNPVTLVPNGADTIMGTNANCTLNLSGVSFICFNTGTDWRFY